VSLAATTARMLARYGRAMTLRRRTGTTTSFTDVAVIGVLHNFSPEELAGGVMQGDARIIIGAGPVIASAGFGQPRKGDFVVADGRTWQVQGAQARADGSTVVGYEIHGRGG
jgi:hypothetical protein